MFRSRSKFHNEAPMSRRGMRIGLVVTVVLAMVAVLASTVGVISSQSTTPSLTFGSGTYSVTEGESLTITLNATSTENYDLVLSVAGTTPASFEFDNDITSLVLSPDVGSPTPITELPQTVSIESRTTVITLWFRAANDLIAETGDKLVLNAQPGSGTTVNTEITLTDPPTVEATFSVTSTPPITEGGSAEIGITLNNPLTLSHLFGRRSGQSGYTREEFTGSNFEDISSIAGAAFPVDDNNEQYNRNLGFDFWFYGTRHSNIAVHTNGFVGFTNDAKANVDEFVDTSPPGTNQGDKTPGTGGFILPIVAPLLSPLAYHITDSHGMGLTPRPAFYGARLGAGTADDRYIVQYTNARAGVPGVTNRVEVTFQVALYANGTIEFRYENVPTNAQGVSKIGISNGTGTGMFDEFSYRAANLGATSNVRLVYTPKDSLINAVIKNPAGTTVETVDILENVAIGAQSGSFMVSHPDNTDWDGDQAYTVELASTVPLVTAPSPAPAAVTYTVEDNDAPEVTLGRVSGSGPIAEGGSVELRASLGNAPGGAPEALTVNLSTASVTTLGFSEYTFQGVVMIPQNGQHIDFTVNIHQDTVVELDELLQLSVSRLDYGTTMHTPMPMPSFDLNIRSDDMITAEITAANLGEGDGTVNVTVKLGQALLSGVAANSLMLVLDGTDRTADIMSGLPADITQALKDGRETTVQVVLNDDNRLEGDEVVNVRLEYTTSDIPFLPATSGSFTIIDNDSGMVEIVPPSVSEYYESVGGNNVQGQTVDFELVLDLPPGVTTDIPVIVNYEIVAPTGLVTVSAPGLGMGFAQGLALPVRGLAQAQQPQRSVTIPAGMNRVVLTITLLDDTKAEFTEQLTVRLLSVSTGSAVPLVEVDPQMKETVITVLDDEDPVFEIIGNGEVNEDDGTYPVQLRRRGRLTHNGMAVNQIEFEIVGEGADEGDFRGPLIRKFTFSPGSALSDLIRLPLDDDDSEESEKTFQIRVYAPGQMPGQVTPPPGPTPIVDSSGARFTSITLFDSDVADYFGDLPATGGLELPIWLVVLLALTGVALLIPAFKLNR